MTEAGRMSQAARTGSTVRPAADAAAGSDSSDLRLLVERARASDPDAWESLYRRAYGPLYAYARRRLPTSGESDDAVSETLARAYQQIGRFRWRGGGFDAWLFTICRNVVFEAQRANGRSGLHPAPEPTDPDPGPLDRLLADEEARRIRAAFMRLAPSDQEVLELRVVAGLAAAEVGAVLGKRAGAVRMAQARALDRLRALLREEA